MAKIWINSKREIIEGNSKWDELANRNKAGFLQAEQITGASLLSFVKGDAVRMFLDAIITRVLVTGKSYLLHYRCDSGTKAQFMKMLVKREADDTLSIEHEHVESRNISPAILFTEDDEAMEKRCAICGKVEFNQEWYDALTNRRIFGTLKELKTHSSICPACDQDLVQHVNDER